MNPSRKVLLGAAGTETAFAAAAALRRVWGNHVRIIAMDTNPPHLVTASLLADAFEQVPPAATPEFTGILVDVLRKHAVDIYLPLLPREFLVIAKLREEGALCASLHVLGPSAKAGWICSDKWETARWLVENNLPVPRTALGSEPFQANVYFIKPREGNGSYGARIVQAPELRSAVGSSPESWIVQELCDMPEVTVDAFYDPEKDYIFSICRERLTVKSGVCTKARLFSDPQLNAMAKTIGRYLPLAGTFCFQAMRCNGRWAVTDINPRPGAATAMGQSVGSDFFAAAFARVWGEDFRCFLTPLTRETFITRQYAEFVTAHV